ncbi:MAG: DUF2085 domain-containing protein [Anaerolineales bacterium]
MSTTAVTARSKPAITVTDWLSNHWFKVFLIVYGSWVFTPFLAPLFMRIGWDGAGKVIYLIYSFFCHQLPERSYFLFGQKPMYSLPEIQAAWQNTINPMVLRQFIGNEGMGWKIAWSDRMISFYTSVWLFAVLWYPWRRKIKVLSWWGFILLLLPMILDGGTHLISDLYGIGQGFRDANFWLVSLTNNSLSVTFYAGDMLGSFNSWMRIISGLLAGLGLAWLVFPYFSQTQVLTGELDKLSYEKVIAQIKSKNPNQPD